MPAPRKGVAARGEASGDPRTITSHGLTLTLPEKLPFAMLRYAKSSIEPADAIGIMTELLGDEQMQQVWAANLSVDDGLDLFTEILAASGVTPGEPSASPTS